MLRGAVERVLGCITVENWFGAPLNGDATPYPNGDATWAGQRVAAGRPKRGCNMGNIHAWVAD